MSYCRKYHYWHRFTPFPSFSCCKLHGSIVPDYKNSTALSLSTTPIALIAAFSCSIVTLVFRPHPSLPFARIYSAVFALTPKSCPVQASMAAQDQAWYSLSVLSSFPSWVLSYRMCPSSVRR